MIVGCPREVKINENRVGITPAMVKSLKARGHSVLVQSSAGMGSGFSDEEYMKAGAEIVDSAKEIWERSEMIVKVKEPYGSELDMLRENQIIFTYLHLASSKELTKKMLDSGCIGIAYETVMLDDGYLPLLSPMSQIAGRMASHMIARYLQKGEGGMGKLVSGVPGVEPAKIVIVGGGNVGTEAAKIAIGMGAEVVVADINPRRLAYLDDVFGSRIKTVVSNEHNLETELRDADGLVGAVLIPGAMAPKVVSREMVKGMPNGSVAVDVSIDQGGCIETSKPTDHKNPVFVEEGVVHYCVTNMPGAVPKTSTLALTSSTEKYVIMLADFGMDALNKNRELAHGLNTLRGSLVIKEVADAFSMEYKPNPYLM